MNTDLQRLFPTLSKSASRGWTLAIVFILLLIIVLQYDALRGERNARRMAYVTSVASTCQSIRDGEKCALIKLAAEIVKDTGFHYVADCAKYTLPDLPAASKDGRAEWIVRNYDRLHYDAANECFRLVDHPATTQAGQTD